MYDRLYLRIAPVLLLLVAAGFHLTRFWWRTYEPLAAGLRPTTWAEPISLPGVDNLYRVSASLYRGEQPSAEGIRKLIEQFGVKTIVNLRSFHSDRQAMGGEPVGYEHITMKAWHPEDKETVRFLRIVGDPANVPVFVHCQHGADRTGTMCAIYRIVVQGWNKEDAISEMTLGGYGYHVEWTRLIEYLRELDVEAIKQEADWNGR